MNFPLNCIGSQWLTKSFLSDSIALQPAVEKIPFVLIILFHLPKSNFLVVIIIMS